MILSPPQDLGFASVVNSTKCRFRLSHWIAFNRVCCKRRVKWSLIAPVSAGLVVNANPVSSLTRFRLCVPSRREPLILSRRKRVRLTAEQIHADLDRLCEDAPVQDAQAALRDLRQ